MKVVLEGELNFPSSLYPFLFFPSHLRTWTSHLQSTPLPDLHSLCTGLFVPWGWQPSRAGILAGWQGCPMSPWLWNYSACSLWAVYGTFPLKDWGSSFHSSEDVHNWISVPSRPSQEVEHQELFCSGFIKSSRVECPGAQILESDGLGLIPVSTTC